MTQFEIPGRTLTAEVVMDAGLVSQYRGRGDAYLDSVRHKMLAEMGAEMGEILGLCRVIDDGDLVITLEAEVHVMTRAEFARLRLFIEKMKLRLGELALDELETDSQSFADGVRAIPDDGDEEVSGHAV